MQQVDLATSAYAISGPSRQLAAVRAAAKRVRSALDTMPAVTAVYSLPRVTLPYPTRFAFAGAARAAIPIVSMLHRTLVVQFDDGDRTRTLLFNPTDVERARNTPYFARFLHRVGRLERLISRPYPSLEEQLSALGIDAEDIDYIAFDHFHTQDVRALLGTEDGAMEPLFPRATLLAPAVEWNDWDHVHPLQRDFMIAEGRRGARQDNVVLLEHDAVVGPGLMLVRTPGHTCGNQTLFIKTTRGIWGVSENGTSADCWQPRISGIAGLRAFSARTGLEVAMNSNTPEASATQYASMLLERAVVDADAEGRIQMWPSSEITPSALNPTVRPAIVWGELRIGTPTCSPRRTQARCD